MTAFCQTATAGGAICFPCLLQMPGLPTLINWFGCFLIASEGTPGGCHLETQPVNFHGFACLQAEVLNEFDGRLSRSMIS
jgi:hypothetical protein